MVEYQIHLSGDDAWAFWPTIRDAAVKAGFEEAGLGVLVTHFHHLKREDHLPHLLMSINRLGDRIVTDETFDVCCRKDIKYTLVRVSDHSDMTKFIMER